MEGRIRIGSRVRLTERVDMPYYMNFEAGHEFTVYGCDPVGMRGWDLIDDDGHKLDETAMISDKFELIKE